MADDTTRDELARLRDEFATFRAQVERERRRRFPRRLLPLTLVALLVALLPLSLLAATPFNDLTGGVHDANIEAIYNAGITTGCVPNESYCPTDNVTRQEMASFLARTAGLGTNPPVANAKTAQTATSAIHATSADNATNATNATNAGNANTVGGYAPGALLRAAQATDGTQIFGGDVGPTNVTVTPPGFQPIVTVAVTAPRAGFVLVTGQLAVQHLDGNLSSLRTRLRDTTGGITNGRTSPPVQSLLAFGGEAQGLTYVFPVAAGQHTFVMECQNAGGINWSVGSGVLTALYVPFGHDGGTTLEP